jgi:hypothetical protein
MMAPTAIKPISQLVIQLLYQFLNSLWLRAQNARSVQTTMKARIPRTMATMSAACINFFRGVIAVPIGVCSEVVAAEESLLLWENRKFESGKLNVLGG